MLPYLETSHLIFANVSSCGWIIIFFLKWEGRKRLTWRKEATAERSRGVGAGAHNKLEINDYKNNTLKL